MDQSINQGGKEGRVEREASDLAKLIAGGGEKLTDGQQFRVSCMEQMSRLVRSYEVTIIMIGQTALLAT